MGQHRPTLLPVKGARWKGEGKRRASTQGGSHNACALSSSRLQRRLTVPILPPPAPALAAAGPAPPVLAAAAAAEFSATALRGSAAATVAAVQRPTPPPAAATAAAPRPCRHIPPPQSDLDLRVRGAFQGSKGDACGSSGRSQNDVFNSLSALPCPSTLSGRAPERPGPNTWQPPGRHKSQTSESSMMMLIQVPLAPQTPNTELSISPAAKACTRPVTSSWT